jgi:hypothetical protein
VDPGAGCPVWAAGAWRVAASGWPGWPGRAPPAEPGRDRSCVEPGGTSGSACAARQAVHADRVGSAMAFNFLAGDRDQAFCLHWTCETGFQPIIWPGSCWTWSTSWIWVRSGPPIVPTGTVALPMTPRCCCTHPAPASVPRGRLNGAATRHRLRRAQCQQRPGSCDHRPLSCPP